MLQTNLDIIWIILSSVLVFLMQAGFLCLETGLTRSKNNINVAIKNLADFSLSALIFWLIGFGLMFGNSLNGWVGISQFAPDLGVPVSIPVFFVFQVMFCGTAVTILSGGVAERLRFNSYLIACILVSALIYPVFGHWAWNGLFIGETTGWLAEQGFIDFAGSTVVHSVGGWVTLALLFVVGPRTGRFLADGSSNNIPQSNVPLAALGSLILYVGWLGFNGGSHLAFDDGLPRILLNTLLAGASGLCAILLFEILLIGKINAGHMLNGLLAGLVAVTGGANVFSTSAAILSGAIGSFIMLGADKLLIHWKVDDAVGAVPVHLAAGIWGTLAVGLLGNSTLLETELSRPELILIQLLGIVVCGIWTFGLSYLIFWSINRIYPLRVPHDKEHIGLNISEHNASSELFDLFTTMDIQSKNADVTLRVPEEPFTTVGQIAVKYNKVMDRLETKTKQAAVASRAKNRFLANMSHEMRTPLNAIIGYSESILEVAASEQHIDGETEEDLFRIAQSGRHLLALINDILDLSKLDEDKVILEEEPFNLRECVTSTINLLSHEAKNKGLGLSYEISTLPSEYFEGDSVRLRQILLNLISNGLKFTKNGSVSLHVNSKSVENNRCIIEFRVKDTGIGIPPSRINAIFNVFSQADESISRNYGGTGLGLAITKSLIELMGGTIQVESQEQVGSIFSFTINLRMMAY